VRAPPSRRGSRDVLTKRIIPCLDVDAGRVVKGISFVNLRDAGDPAELASYYDQEGADDWSSWTSPPAPILETPWSTS